MHRTLRQPAAKVARLRRRVRRGRQGVGAGRGRRGGIVCGVPFCSPMCGSTRRFLRAFYLTRQRTQTAALGRGTGRSPARQPDDTRRTGPASRQPRDETRPAGTPRDLRPRSNSHTSAHVDARDLHTVTTDMQVAYALSSYGARRPNPHQPPSTQGLNRGTTGPSSPHQSQSHHKREPATQPANNRHPDTTPTNHQSPRW